MKAILLAALVCSFTACVDEGTDRASDDEVVFETVVEVHADGTTTVGEPRELTVGEQRAQNEQRVAIEAGEIEAPTRIDADSSCPFTAFWLYSRSDYTGSRICFTGLGRAWPGYYTRYILVGGKPFAVGNWAISSGSYWPGVNGGRMFAGITFSPTWEVSWVAHGLRSTFAQPSAVYELVLY